MSVDTLPRGPEAFDKFTRAAAVSTGAMIALVPSDEDAKRLAVEGGEPVDQLHLTLRYLGKAKDLTEYAKVRLIDLVRSNFTTFGPITADMFSLAVFNPGDAEPCVVGLVGGDDVWRAYLASEAAVEDSGADVPDPRQPYVAHVTLEYTDDASRVADLTDREGPVTFDRVRVAFGDVVTDIPLTGASATRNWQKQPRDPGGADGGQWVGTGGAMKDALKMADRVGSWLGPGDVFEGSARLDGLNGAATMILFRANGEPGMGLSTLRPDAIDAWAASDDDDSIAYLDADAANDVAVALGKLIEGIRRNPNQPRTQFVWGADIGNVRLRASTVDGEPGVDVLVASYQLDQDDKDYLKERAKERADLVRELEASSGDDDEDFTADELDAIRQDVLASELADFDAETEADVADAAARRTDHTIRFSLEQAATLRDRLTRFADAPPIEGARVHIGTSAGSRDWKTQPRDPGGEGGGQFISAGVPNVDVPGAGHGGHDRLKLAARIPLESGQTLVRSDVLDFGEGVVMPLAWTNGPEGSRVRIGVGINEEDGSRWRGANLGSTVILDDQGVGKLREGLTEMRSAGDAGTARQMAIETELNASRAEQRSLIRTQYPNLTSAEAAELAELDGHLADTNGFIEVLKGNQSKRLGRLSAEAQARFAQLEADKAAQTVRGRDVIEQYWATGGTDNALLDEYQASTVQWLDMERQQHAVLLGLTLDELDELSDLEALGPVLADSTLEQRRRRLELLNSPTGLGEDGWWGYRRDERKLADLTTERENQLQPRREELTADPVPLTDETLARIAVASAKVERADRELWDLIDGGVLASGIVPGEWGDLAYQTEMTDLGPRYSIDIRPPDSPTDWGIGDNGESVDLDPKDLQRLAAVLAGTPAPASREQRKFNKDQPRDTDGQWTDGVGGISAAAVSKVKDALSKTYGTVSSHVDKQGAHFGLTVKGQPVQVDVSYWDMIQLATLFIPGGAEIGALKLAGIVGKSLKAAKASKKAAIVAKKAAAVASHTSTGLRVGDAHLWHEPGGLLDQLWQRAQRDVDFEAVHPRNPDDGKFVENPVVTLQQMFNNHGLLVAEEQPHGMDDTFVGLYTSGEVVVSTDAPHLIGEKSPGRVAAAYLEADSARDVADLIDRMYPDANGYMEELDEDEDAAAREMRLADYDLTDSDIIVGYNPDGEILVGWPKDGVENPDPDKLQEDFDVWVLESFDASNFADALRDVADFEPQEEDTVGAGGSYDLTLFNDHDIAFTADGGDSFDLLLNYGQATSVRDALVEFRDAGPEGGPPEPRRVLYSIDIAATPDGAVTLSGRDSDEPFVTIKAGDLPSVVAALDSLIDEADWNGRGRYLAADESAEPTRAYSSKLHPKYPKGTPGGKGGEWMPQVGEALDKLANLHGRGPVKVRPEIGRLKSVADVNTRLRIELRRTLQRSVDVDLGEDTNLITAKEYAEGLLRGAERWPETRLDKVSVGTPPDGYKVWGLTIVQPKTGQVEMLLDAEVSANRTKYLRSLRKGGEAGRPGNDFSYIAASLFGSAVDGMTGGRGHEHVDVAVKSYLHDAGLDHSDPHQIQAGIKAQLGDHALHSRNAMVAEALADDALHGDGASPLAQQVRHQLATAYNSTLNDKAMPAVPSLPRAPVAFVPAKAKTYNPTKGTKYAKVVDAPEGSVTTIVPEWGGEQRFVGSWVKVIDPDTGATKYGSALSEWMDMHERVPGEPDGWQKTATVDAYQHRGEPGTLTTVLADGTVETENAVNEGDWIVRQKNGEVQIIKDEKFRRLYDSTKPAVLDLPPAHDGEVLPAGLATANVNAQPGGPDISDEDRQRLPVTAGRLLDLAHEKNWYSKATSDVDVYGRDSIQVLLFDRLGSDDKFHLTWRGPEGGGGPLKLAAVQYSKSGLFKTKFPLSIKAVTAHVAASPDIAPTAAPDLPEPPPVYPSSNMTANELIDSLMAAIPGSATSGKTKNDLTDRTLEAIETAPRSPAATMGGPNEAIARLSRVNRPESIRAAANATNPHYGTTQDGPTYREAGKAGARWTSDMGPLPWGAYEENCSNVVYAFEMRMRGYDVEAAPLDILDKYGYAGGRTDKEMDQLLADAWRLPDGRPHGRTLRGQAWRSFAEIDADIEQNWPEGGRGVIFVGKHIFSVVKVRGKAQFVEAQSDASASRTVTTLYKKKYRASRAFSGPPEEAKLVRLDDLAPADGVLEAVTERTRG